MSCVATTDPVMTAWAAIWASVVRLPRDPDLPQEGEGGPDVIRPAGQELHVGLVGPAVHGLERAVRMHGSLEDPPARDDPDEAEDDDGGQPTGSVPESNTSHHSRLGGWRGNASMCA